MHRRFIDPLTDFGFKRLFGSEPNLDLLLDFLNAILPPANRIRSLTLRRTEYAGKHAEDRKAFIDVYCVGENGERFIVEVQRLWQNNFVDRCMYYSTFSIQEQAKRGSWDFELTPVYVVGILDFMFPDRVAEGEYFHIVEMKDQLGRVF